MYVSVDDNNFYKFINKKYAEFKIPPSHKTLKQICFPKKYEFQIPQKFLAEFINPDTPYKGILVYHRIGAGKTCTAINIAENFKNYKKIMIVLPAALKGNFRSELRSLCADDKYLTDSERSILKTLHPSTIEYKELIKKSDARIDKYYTIYSYNKFASLIKEETLQLNNTLLIIDEVHNMISETGTYYELLYDIVHAAGSLKLVIMSATPIFDKPIEIALTMNLLLPKKKQFPTGQAFISTYMDIKYEKKGLVYNIKNIDLFKKTVRGYVSYFRGAPPIVFPRTELFITRCKMSEKQYKLYSKIMQEEKKKFKVKDYVNLDISNSFFLGTRMVSNCVFPNGKLGKSGYDSLVKSGLDLEVIRECSPKFLKILRRIRKSIGTIFVYSNFREYGGIKTFTTLLEYYGYKNYEKNGAGKKRFAIFSGEQSFVLKEEIKVIFNNKNNEDGMQLKVVCGSPSVKEGISFLRVSEVHIIEPYWNFSRMDQVIGRAVRFCSHKDLPYDRQHVSVYIYLAVHQKIKKSIDEYIMNMAVQKKYINGKFEMALKEASVDCELFKNANVHPGEEDIKCVK